MVPACIVLLFHHRDTTYLVVTSIVEDQKRTMTLVDKLIHQQFRFELGMAKLGFYVALLNLMITLTTLLTVKGIFVPIWLMVPFTGFLILFLLVFGYYLETYNVIARLNSHMNRKGNPEFVTLIETIDRMEKKIDDLQERLKRNGL